MDHCQAEYGLQVSYTFSNMSDDALVALAKDGEHSAFSELCDRHSSRIFRTVFRIARNKEDAEDAVQESWIRAFIHLKTFDGRSSFPTWLTRIAINSALMILRKKRAHRESFFDGQEWWSLQIIDPTLDPERSYIEQEKEMRLRTAVRRLPPLLRDVAISRYADESSLNEVAAATGVSLAAAKSRLLRARSSLRHALSEGSPRKKSKAALRRSKSLVC
jgi:RNA polymerase sigma-70 factor, ECF subfamily